MQTSEVIRKKRDGGELTEEELGELVERYTNDEVPDYQMSAFLMAVYFNGFSSRELSVWTDAMLHSGDVFDLSAIPGPHVDKHSTGGVGDKVSLVLAPLAVAAGVKVPMISGRGLGHTGGTLDKLESIPGFDVEKSPEEFLELIERVGGAIVGQTSDIAPADRRLYALRDVTGTVECIPLIASSIMSKKLAEGIGGLVLDVKVGSGAFMGTLEEADRLARTMIDIGESTGTSTRALITDMSQPLGAAVGNAVETAEAIDSLRGGGPSDLRKIVVELVAEMKEIGGSDQSRSAIRDELERLLDAGEALATFREMIEAQGGEPEVCDRPRAVLPTADEVLAYEASSEGWIGDIDAREVGLASLELGAGRETQEDEVDPAVGLVFEVKRGARVEAGESIVEIHAEPDSDVEACRERLDAALEIVDERPEETPL
ncbi:MAG: thymidine phosphorylase, partial [Bradymonadaceae bacterium]